MSAARTLAETTTRGETMDRQPSQTHRTTLFVHPVGPGGPLTVDLPGCVLSLIERFDKLHRRQAGETVLPATDEDPELAACTNITPGEQELCLVGGVAMLLRCEWKTGEELMIVSEQEAEQIRFERSRLKLALDRRPAGR